MDRFLVQEGAAARPGVKQFVCDWIENYADDRLAVFQEANRSGETRVAMCEIRGSIKRVDMPDKRRRRTVLPRAFFRDDRMFGKIAPQSGHNCRFRTSVGLGD